MKRSRWPAGVRLHSPAYPQRRSSPRMARNRGTIPDPATRRRRSRDSRRRSRRNADRAAARWAATSGQEATPPSAASVAASAGRGMPVASHRRRMAATACRYCASRGWYGSGRARRPATAAVGGSCSGASRCKAPCSPMASRRGRLPWPRATTTRRSMPSSAGHSRTSPAAVDAAKRAMASSRARGGVAASAHTSPRSHSAAARSAARERVSSAIDSARAASPRSSWNWAKEAFNSSSARGRG